MQVTPAKITLYVDEKALVAPEGQSLLRVCLANDIYIPNLCHLEELEEASASCRLCFVEVEGKPHPVPACVTLVREGLRVRTDTPAVRALQREALRLLLSTHRVDCAHCPVNKRCELQRMAAFLRTGLRPKDLAHLLREPEIVRAHPLYDYYPNRCVLCGRCVRLCRERQPLPLLTFTGRGHDTTVAFYGHQDLEDAACASCGACVKACPVAALWPREQEAAGPARPRT